MDIYQFTGCSPFVERAADSLGVTDAKVRAQARTQVAVSRAQTSIGQACAAKPEHRQAMLDEAIKWRLITAIALAGLDLAIAEAIEKLGIEVQESEPEPDSNTDDAEAEDGNDVEAEAEALPPRQSTPRPSRSRSR